jgi:hypothetical protein
MPLDFFVCFSSVSALLGATGQGGYAAANAFLDSFAHYRRSLGLPACAIDWGMWDETGMAAEMNQRARSNLIHRGLGVIPVETALAALMSLEKSEVEMWQRMLRAYGGALYPLDLVALGALNRSAALCSGFRSLVEARNFICAASILRLQLDTALRFYAAFLVTEPHAFASAVLKGTPVRKLKDRTGTLMHDRHLVSCLSLQHPWVAKVYETTSGYIHLSEQHIFQAIESVEERERLVKIKISAADKELSEQTYVEAVEAFCAATQVFHHYVEVWIVAKDNPEAVARLRKKKDNAGP